jgi:hypothetical protein
VINNEAAKAAGKIVGPAADAASDALDSAMTINRLNRQFGNAPSTAIPQSVLDNASQLNGLKKFAEGAATAGEYAQLGVDVYEKGPTALGDFAVEKVTSEVGEKVLGKRGFAIVSEGVKTYQRVEAAQNERRRNLQSADDIRDLLIAATRKSYYVDKFITFEEFEQRIRDINAAYELMQTGAQNSGEAEIGIESLKGLQNMLESLIGG